MMRFDKTTGVLLADVPGSGIARKDANARSGNPLHDTRSGKFGSGGGGEKGPAANPPANQDPMEWKRMLDAAREAAREYDIPAEGDIREFLAGRARNPEAVDVQGFLAQVIEEKKNDLVDALDQTMRQSGPLQRGRRRVGIKVPRNYLRKLIGNLEEDDLAEVMARLEAMGHQREAVDAYFDGRVRKPEVAEKAKPKRDALAASDIGWTAEDVPWGSEPWSAPESDMDPIELVDRITKNLPAPQVTLQPIINVEVPKPGPTKNTMVRDPETGLAQYTISEPLEPDAS